MVSASITQMWNNLDNSNENGIVRLLYPSYIEE